MIAVAVLVCGFAVGMAGLLNYFKYRSTANRLVTERLVVTGKSVESSIQAALALGMQFGDIGTLPGTLDRERATDNLIMGIDVFDTEGRLLYTTDRLRSTRPVPQTWLAAARKAVKDNWFVESDQESAAGISVKNNFGLTIGYLAIRYSGDQVRDAAYTVGKRLALSTLLVFGISAALSSLAVLAVMRRLTRDVQAVEGALRSGDASRAATVAADGPFGAALQRFVQTTQGAEREISDLRARMQSGARAPVAARPAEAPTVPTGDERREAAAWGQT
ncbi:hypothetical protein [Ideonella sp. A 288]|uniref:hypothetical protein n=1 Tax=Ideonella sp. A 288 TaxID=1962181 RepID=UPI000B4BC4B5|nr:hypothetical protein [Ideonella sp. A 288]